MRAFERVEMRVSHAQCVRFKSPDRKLQIPEAADSCRLSAGWGCFTSFFGRILKCPFLFSNKFI